MSDGGGHAHRLDKIGWNEPWMGWAVAPPAAAQSNVELAPNLPGKRLRMVGEMDRNVDPASTLQGAAARIKANKAFALVVVPGAGCGVAASPSGQRRLPDIFVGHLPGREPRGE